MTNHRPLEELVDFSNFEKYVHALVKSKDCDPTYPLIKQVIKEEKFDPEWFLFVYVLYYNLDAAIQVCRIFPTRESWSEPEFKAKAGHIRKFGAERRGTHRIYENQLKAFEGWFAVDLTEAQWTYGCYAFRELIKSIPFQGDWAAFKLTELHEKSLGFQNLAPKNMDIGVRDVNSSLGPVGGCRCLYGIEHVYPQSIATEWEAMGVSMAARWGYDLGEIETALCKWSKMSKGSYFVGHDIQEFIHLKHLWSPEVFNMMMESCEFPKEMWKQELDVKKLKKAYKDKKVLEFC